jgi:hypothetical protein
MLAKKSILPGTKLLLSFILLIAVGLVFVQSAQALTASPSSYNWGQIDYYQNSSGISIDFQNTEAFPVITDPSGVQITGPNANQFTDGGQSCYSAYLNPGDSCSIWVYVNPTVTGPINATVSLSDDSMATVSVPLSAEPTIGTPYSVPDPVIFNMQPYYYGSQYQEVRVYTDSNLSTQMNTVSLSGPDASHFSISYDGCGGAFVYQNNYCNVNLIFDPQGSPGSYNATLTVTSESQSSPLTIPLQAVVLSGPKAVPNPPSIDFGVVEVGQSSDPQTVTITNEGDFPLEVQQALIVSGTPSAFVISSNSCLNTSIIPGGSCSFDVVLTPTRSGDFGAAIYIITNTPAPTEQLPLQGVGEFSTNPAAYITGVNNVGNLLNCRTSNTVGQLSYRWLRNNKFISARGSQYRLQNSDINKRISCQVRAFNSVSDKTSLSPQTGFIQPRLLENLGFTGNKQCRIGSMLPKRINLSKGAITVEQKFPTTGSSPIVFRSKKAFSVKVASITQQGKTIVFNPRTLARLANGTNVFRFTRSGNSKLRKIVLSDCYSSGRSILGYGTKRIRIAAASRYGAKSIEIKLLGARIKNPGKAGTQLIVRAYRNQQVFSLRSSRTNFNGIKVRLQKDRILLKNLPQDTALVNIELRNKKIIAFSKQPRLRIISRLEDGSRRVANLNLPVH